VHSYSNGTLTQLHSCCGHCGCCGGGCFHAAQEDPHPADVTDWVVVGFSDAAVDFIDSILTAQSLHKHWKAGGFAVSAFLQTKVTLPKIQAGQRLKAGAGGKVDVSDDRVDDFSVVID
jgi:hypothetical protein